MIRALKTTADPPATSRGPPRRGRSRLRRGVRDGPGGGLPKATRSRAGPAPSEGGGGIAARSSVEDPRGVFARRASDEGRGRLRGARTRRGARAPGVCVGLKARRDRTWRPPTGPPSEPSASTTRRGPGETAERQGGAIAARAPPCEHLWVRRPDGACRIDGPHAGAGEAAWPPPTELRDRRGPPRSMIYGQHDLTQFFARAHDCGHAGDFDFTRLGWRARQYLPSAPQLGRNCRANYD